MYFSFVSWMPTNQLSACHFVQVDPTFVTSIKPKQAEQQMHSPQELYFSVFREEIIAMKRVSNKKVWSEDEDQFLLSLNPDSVNWKHISAQISNTNPDICRRRYFRLKEKLFKWPKEVDCAVTHLYEVQKLSWREIRETIIQKYYQTKKSTKLTTNAIKQRYLYYLQSGICREEWSIEEDLEIIRMIRQFGKNWVKKIPSESSLSLRPILLIKNRYFGTLRFLEKKVDRKVNARLRQQKISQ